METNPTSSVLLCGGLTPDKKTEWTTLEAQDIGPSKKSSYIGLSSDSSFCEMEVVIHDGSNS